MSAAPRHFEAGWEAGREKLLCLILLDDEIGQHLSSRAGDAFFRAFIVGDRITGAVQLKARWKYKDPDEQSWFSVTPDKRGSEAVECLQVGITKTLTTPLSMIAGRDAPEDAVHIFYPPDDGGDPAKTIIWLDMKDLIEIKEKARA
jgi:hypothetical protein